MRNLYILLLIVFTATSINAQTIVKNINSGAASSSPYPVASIGSNMIFFCDDGTKGIEPWVSDGSVSGTKILLDINPAAGVSSFIGIGAMLFNGKFYFGANDGSTGAELWSTDGTTAGTAMVMNINPGTANGFTGNQIALYNGKLYFAANDGVTGTELWSSDGTAAGTTIVKNISPGIASSNPTRFTVALGKLFFNADDGTSGKELWKTDGTTANTLKVGDIGAAALSGDPEIATEFQGFVYFSAQSTAAEGRELWRSDGSSLELVKNINPAAAASSYPGNFTVVGTTLFFTADDGSLGTELWKTDGTAVGTVIVKNINPGSASSNPFLLGAFNGKLLFSAVDATSGQELWTSDGLAAGTSQIMDINSGTGNGFSITTSNILENARAIPYTDINNGIFYFAGNDGTNGVELWKTNGTAAGTAMVGQMNPSTGSSSLDWIFIANNKIWMSAIDGTSGRELFKYDIPVVGGIGTASSLFKTGIYPNPAQNNITISGKGHTVIYDMNGRIADAFENTGEAHDISDFRPGMYIVNTMIGDKLFSVRFVKN